MAKTLWQKIDQKISRLKIFRNSATLICSFVKSDPLLGTTVGFPTALPFVCREPESVSCGMVDNQLVYTGDCQIMIDYMTMRKLYEQISGSGIAWNESFGFIQAGIDKVRFGEVSYVIRSIIPQDWQNNQPGQYLLILKT